MSVQNRGHKGWVKSSHWIITISFLILAFTGVEMLMVHPRLYWGQVGNELTPAVFEFPISRNYHHGGFEKSTPIFDRADSPVSAARTYDIFNQNGWGRSLHFLAAWLFVVTGLIYLLLGIFSGHLWRHIFPGREFSRKNFVSDVKEHLRMKIPPPTGGPQYGLLQKTTYVGVIFFALPLMVITGFGMSPAMSNAYPFLLDMFGGYQSARTVHFFAFVALIFFLIIHITMTVLSGFKKHIRSMTIGKAYEKETTDHPA